MEDFRPAFPELTFTDRMTLHLGDTTMNIRYFGIAHTNSDVLIEIAEDKVLFVGDLFFARWLPGLRKREGIFHQGPWDVPRWIESLNAVLDGKRWSAIISGHGDLIPQETLVNWRNYIRDLWNGLKDAKAEGVTLEVARRRFSLSEKFPYLEKMGYEPNELQEFHHQTIEMFWNLL
jgi:cyclase